VLNRLKDRWTRLSRGDQIALLLAEVVVVAVFLMALSASEFTRAEWLSALLVYGVVFWFLQGSLIFVMAVIASRRQKAATTPGGKIQAGFGRLLVACLALGALVWAGGYVADWMFPESEWATKWRYSLDNDLKDPVYVFEKHPHDCEFLSAPLGTIHVRIAQSGARQVSYDDGKSWSSAKSDVRTTVFVSWTKVEE
jgi:multisubunit Na+/H+ antiporter MnhG subunit